MRLALGRCLRRDHHDGLRRPTERRQDEQPQVGNWIQARINHHIAPYTVLQHLRCGRYHRKALARRPGHQTSLSGNWAKSTSKGLRRSHPRFGREWLALHGLLLRGLCVLHYEQRAFLLKLKREKHG